MNLQEWAGVQDRDPRTTLAIVFTDIIDSTTLARTVGDKEMFDMLVDHFDAARALCSEYHGFEIKLIGDAYMAVFRTADHALRFALDFQASTGNPRIDIRVGIHVGQVRITHDDIYGLQVNLAQRLSHVSVRGEVGIFLSSTAKKDIQSEYGSAFKGFLMSPVLAATLKGFGTTKEEVWQILTPEIRLARGKRLRAQQERDERKAPKPISQLTSTTPDKPTFDLGPRRSPPKDPTDGPRRK